MPTAFYKLNDCGILRMVIDFCDRERPRIHKPVLFNPAMLLDQSRWGKCDTVGLEEVDGDVIGISLFYLREPTGKPYLDLIYVALEHRGKGIGTRLLHDTLRQMIGDGAKMIYGDVNSQRAVDMIHKLPKEFAEKINFTICPVME